ncbi:unnamed protein product, partial [Mesorhabditis belari]|uniref:Beta-sarcoglycan n=1 Tax=Mesorhabditis belari TaxID=2138241 RepID=A0AAF3FRU8_9BILA
MAQPTYVRSNSESTFRDGASSVKDESELHYAGLRRKKLCALIACLALMSIITIFLFVINLMIIRTLQMDQHGMRFLKFHSVWNTKTKEKEKVVQFSGTEIDLGEVVTLTGKVTGQLESDMDIQGSRVILQGGEIGSRLTLQETGCRIEGASNFQVISSRTGRPLFAAHQPLVSIDWRIKKLSAQKIVTNKIRSPVDESLSISVDNVSIRGNEAIRLEGNKINFSSPNSLGFNTSTDGSLHLHGRISIGNPQREFPLSQSPALSASVDAYRVCICSGGKSRLFIVPGNKPCMATFDIC